MQFASQMNIFSSPRIEGPEIHVGRREDVMRREWSNTLKNAISVRS
jgi:hypothetical protein